jgi:hypothetical protein
MRTPSSLSRSTGAGAAAPAPYNENGGSMTAPALVYLGMGFIVARIILDGKRTRGFTWLQWLQFLVDAARIVLLWPLVLLVEKVVTWLKTETIPAHLQVEISREKPEELIAVVERGGEER